MQVLHYQESYQPQPHKQLPGQSVFRVQPTSPTYRKEASGTSTTSGAAGTGGSFHSRRSHRKSRTGCRNCKERRIKCDENRDGGCEKCRCHGLECDYLSIRSSVRTKVFELRQRTTIEASAIDKTDAWLAFPLPTGSRGSELSPLSSSLFFRPSLPIALRPGETLTVPLATLHQFSTLTSYTVGSPQGQIIIQSCILSMAMQTPYLLHALLGVAALHMTVLLPATANAVQHAKHKLADAYHWGQALKLFRAELATTGPKETNMDALLSTIMIVAIYQFALRDTDASTPQANHGLMHEKWRDSFVFIEDEKAREAAMKWLTIQAGFKVLLTQLEQYLARSVWIPVLHDASVNDGREGISKGKTWQSRPPQHEDDETERLLCKLCGVDENSTDCNNPWYASLETLLHLRRLRPITVRHFNKAITIMGRITPEFKRLLLDRETAALLIIAHWLSLLIGIRQWWLEDRAEQECKAVVIFLRDRGIDQCDEMLRKLLREPAEVVNVDI